MTEQSNNKREDYSSVDEWYKQVYSDRTRKKLSHTSSEIICSDTDGSNKEMKKESCHYSWYQNEVELSSGMTHEPWWAFDWKDELTRGRKCNMSLRKYNKVN